MAPLDFKVRCECAEDAERLRAALQATRRLRVFRTYVSADGLPDTEVVFCADLLLCEARALAKALVDGHVMAETMALAENYTGERTYNS